MTEPYDSAQDTWDHIRRVQELIEHACGNLNDRALDHDQSKLHEPEKSMFDNATQKLKGLTYGSDEYKQSLKELGPALVHHYKHNSHHPEHYCLFPDDTIDTASLEAGHGIESMSLFDIIEMLIDWKAASERHDNGDIYKSITHNTERFGMSHQVANILRKTAKEMGW